MSMPHERGDATGRGGAVHTADLLSLCAPFDQSGIPASRPAILRLACLAAFNAPEKAGADVAAVDSADVFTGSIWAG